MTPMNEQWNKLKACLPNKDDDEETLSLKKFNKPLCAYRKPFFFIYRYNTTKAKYDTYNRKVDTKLKQKYGISLNDLLNGESLSEELQKERVRYYNRCPVDMSQGTINRIAWAVNKRFETFNSLPLTSFDKEIIKSGVEYDAQFYHNVKDIYAEYKLSLSNLAKRTKQDDIRDEEEGIADKAMLNFVFKSKFSNVCPNEKMLCDILIDMLYDKPNSKSVVWDMCGDVIIDNLLEKSGGILEYPEVVTENEEFGCCRRKFRMKQIKIGGEEHDDI